MRIAGVLAMLGFGLIWLVTGVAGFNPGWAAIIGSVLAYAGLAAAAAVLVHRNREEPAVPPTMPADWRRRFNRVGMLQGGAIALVVVLLVAGGLPHLIPAAIALIVGLHFFPLASIFDLPIYRTTALGLCGVAVAGFFLSVTGQSQIGSAVVGLGCALILCLTALALVPGRQDSRPERPPHSPD